LNELVCSCGERGYDKTNQSRDVEPADNRMLDGNGGPMIINLLATWIPALLTPFLGILKGPTNSRGDILPQGGAKANCTHLSAAAKEWATSADQNEPSRYEMMAMKMSPALQADKVFPVVSS
jgi:hypothetical protein